jgi:hypothetical protein
MYGRLDQQLGCCHTHKNKPLENLEDIAMYPLCMLCDRKLLCHEPLRRVYSQGSSRLHEVWSSSAKADQRVERFLAKKSAGFLNGNASWITESRWTRILILVRHSLLANTQKGETGWLRGCCKDSLCHEPAVTMRRWGDLVSSRRIRQNEVE